ncbi:MAG: PPK2 family polyphosphate kinase [Fimbriimonas sp.]
MAYAQVVSPGSKPRLAKIDPRGNGGLTKEAGLAELDRLGARMAELQELLFAARKHALLIILQGRDTSGKDGAIRRMLHYVNVQSTRVVPFKVPTETDLAHDFLWRVHPYTPGRGEISVFNRSHYEDVLVVRVHDLAPQDVVKRRFDHINAFERLLLDSDTLILKFYLHISKEEQEERLLAREAEPEKAWKLSVGDWKERERWDAYTEAYEDVLAKCSPPEAPWRVVPANRKWFRDLAIAESIVQALEPYEGEWRDSLERLGQAQKAELEAYRQTRK